MHGNVREWVEDIYHDRYEGALTDGAAWMSPGMAEEFWKGGSYRYRVSRGGSWNDSSWLLRSAVRSRDGPVIRFNFLGFRVARTLD